MKNIIILNINYENCYNKRNRLLDFFLIITDYSAVCFYHNKAYFRSTFCPTLNYVCFDSLICAVRVIISENVVFDKLNASLEKYLKVF